MLYHSINIRRFLPATLAHLTNIILDLARLRSYVLGWWDLAGISLYTIIVVFLVTIGMAGFQQVIPTPAD
jgi:hypothetical protein